MSERLTAAPRAFFRTSRIRCFCSAVLLTRDSFRDAGRLCTRHGSVAGHPPFLRMWSRSDRPLPLRREGLRKARPSLHVVVGESPDMTLSLRKGAAVVG